MAESVELVVFDLGGTLVEDNGVVPQCFAKVLENAGHALNANTLSELRGRSKKDALRSLVGNEDEADALYGRFIDTLSSELSHAPPSSRRHARQTLETLAEAGVARSVTTGFNRWIAEQILSQLRWDPALWGTLVSSDDIERSRPAPDGIQKAMSQSGVSDASCVAKVGDTEADALAGEAAGVRWNIGLCGGAHSRDRLSLAPTTHVVESLAEVIEVLDVGR